MASIKLNSAQISRVISDHAAKRILADFVADGPGRPGLLGPQFDKAIEKEAHYQANLVAPVLEAELKAHYKSTFDLVTSILSEGVLRNATLKLGVEAPNQLPTNFHKFTRAYFLQKARNNPETSKLFWKYTGKLYKAVRAFSNQRKAGVSWANPRVELVSRGRQQRGRRYRFEINFYLPEIKSSAFLDNVFRRAYLTGANSGRYGAYNKLGFGTIAAVRHSDPLSYLQFNETAGPLRKDGQPKTRPFLTELVSRRGVQVNTILLRKLRELS